MTTTESDMIVVESPPCMVCGGRSQLEMTKAQLDRYLAGAHVQDVFPAWTTSERELVITGTHSACWDKMFPNEDA